LARNGKLIEAIKRYRAIYGVGLQEAKDDILALQANRWVSPSPKN
jgi:ribosomal protein L7/L12